MAEQATLGLLLSSRACSCACAVERSPGHGLCFQACRPMGHSEKAFLWARLQVQ